MIRAAWGGIDPKGSTLWSICRRLKAVKGVLKNLNRTNYANIGERVRIADAEMKAAQLEVLKNPTDAKFATLHKTTDSSNSLRREEEMILWQKARETWISYGDQNTSYFFRSIKTRQARNFISCLRRDDGTHCTSSDSIAKEAVRFYTNMLVLREADAHVVSNSHAYFDDLISKKLLDRNARMMVHSVTPGEVRDAMFSLNSEKSPGPDGFSAQFYKHSWEVAGKDVTAAILDFFEKGEMPLQVNSTNISLIPKVQNADVMTNFRPISCCNVLYKCITKILAKRLSIVLPSIISPSQSAFVRAG
ncbi:Transposon TX1 uncharacterized 149 kDa protein [Linum perenne]